MKIPIEKEILDQEKRNIFLVLSGPTGAGKDAVLEKIQEKDPSTIKIITTTSRPKRSNESEGNPYHFISRQEFEEKIANHEFFEWVEFRGELYGTEKKVLDEAFNSGQDVIWRIEAKGVKNIKEKIKQISMRTILVYLTTKNIDTLEDRVRKDEAGIATNRWNPALVQWEIEQYEDCDYLVVNDDGNLDQTVEKILKIMDTKRLEIIRN